MDIAQTPIPSLNQQALTDLLAEPWTFEEVKRKAFMKAMNRCKNMPAVALSLGISLKCAYNMLHRYTGVPCRKSGYLRT